MLTSDLTKKETIATVTAPTASFAAGRGTDSGTAEARVES